MILPRSIANDLRVFWQSFRLFQAAMQSYVSGSTSYIGFNYASVKTLSTNLRSILVQLVDLNDASLMDLIHYLRTQHRAIERFYASPELFRHTIPARLQALAEAQGGNGLRFRSYIIKAGDTPQSIAQNELGDAARWLDITELNDLSYPYISDDPSYNGNVKARGRVKFTHVSALLSDYVIPAGTVVSTAGGADVEPIEFVTLADKTILAEQLSVDADVECAAAGPIGNVGPTTLTRIAFINADKVTYTYTLSVSVRDVAGNPGTAEREFTYATWPRVSNAETMTGGLLANVATLGQRILLPVPADSPAALKNQELDAADSLYGTDLYLDEEGDLAADQTGDLLIVTGLANLAIALRTRLLTERGDLAFHKDFGSNLHKLLGQLNNAYLRDRVVVEIRDVANSDPRIADTKVYEAAVDEDTIRASVEYVTKTSRDSNSLNLILRS